MVHPGLFPWEEPGRARRSQEDQKEPVAPRKKDVE